MVIMTHESQKDLAYLKELSKRGTVVPVIDGR